MKSLNFRIKNNREIVGIIGLGYVGLPLAVEFSKKYSTIGFDISKQRVEEIKQNIDITLEVSSKDLKKVVNTNKAKFLSVSSGLYPSFQLNDLINSNVYIITVPTPIDDFNKPDFKPLEKATKMVGSILKKDDIVIYESTVYPGATEEICVPILESSSKLNFNKDFYIGYSPERINPGDKQRSITKIIKVTSGSNDKTALFVDNLYKSIIKAGTHLAPSIKVAEAAKVIENSQRDINIAFINELAKIFNLLDIDTSSVLKAAGTKWNFLNFKPGLVGGHCIGVDPFYLAKKAQEIGYNPEIILQGRKLNNSMGKYVANQIIKKMTLNKIKVKKSKILILGVTFKENCPDYRNTKVVDIVSVLKDKDALLTIYDPWVDADNFMNEYGYEIKNKLPAEKFDCIVLAVAHSVFLKLDMNKIKKDKSIVYDVKGFLGEKSDYKL